MAAHFKNPHPQPNDPVSAADFAELVRWVQRLAQSSAPRSLMDQTGLHLRPPAMRQAIWARITNYDSQTHQYGWQEQQFVGSGFSDRPGGRSGQAGGTAPAFEANGLSNVPIGTVVRLHRVGQSQAYVFDHQPTQPSCDPQAHHVSVVTDVACNPDGTLSVTKTDICAPEIMD